jgi:hypothetical protein
MYESQFLYVCVPRMHKTSPSSANRTHSGPRHISSFFSFTSTLTRYMDVVNIAPSVSATRTDLLLQPVTFSRPWRS